MALPTFKAAGTFTYGTGSITPPYPTGGSAPAANDIAILVCESENQAISLTTANGFVELGSQATKSAGTGGVDPASRLAIYWKRCAGGDSAPVVADSGDHTTGRIYLFSGVKWTGNPWNVYAEGNDSGANDTTGVIPGATTTVDNCLVFIINSSSYNATSTAEFGSWTNSNLGSITERGDNTNTAGYGGGHGSATGTKVTAGAYGNTTVTLAHTSYKGAMSIALEPCPTQTISGAGNIASAEALGLIAVALIVSLSGSGIVSSEALGTPQLNTRISVSGIPSVEAFGNPTLSQAQTISQAGNIASAEAFGAAKVNQSISVMGIGTGETFGVPKTILTIGPPGIESAEAFGQPSVVGVQIVYPTGIESQEGFGYPQVFQTQLIYPTGIPSAEQLGTPKIIGGPQLGSATCLEVTMCEATVLDTGVGSATVVDIHMEYTTCSDDLIPYGIEIGTATVGSVMVSDSDTA
jgi:hypothetical protein